MTARELPFHEWDRLPVEMDRLLMMLRPCETTIRVVEDDGHIVAHAVFYRTVHIDGVGVSESHRHSPTVWRHLLGELASVGDYFDCDHAWAASATDEMTKVMTHPRLQAEAVPALPFIMALRRH
jgi:hypothetical protein